MESFSDPFLFWFESGVIGFYNIFKLIKVSGLLSILIVPFFIIHFGGFMAGHLIFIFAFFAPVLSHTSFFPTREIFVPLLSSVALPIIGLFISHGISFFSNFIGNREYEHTDSGKQMNAPYKRIIIMHFTIIFGGWLIMIFKEPILGLVLLVVIKSMVDLRSHLKEHSLLRSSPPA
ncbi:MAG: DUF6498-containing protein [Patescibacteria group bacterium]